jgi:CubicO group peptidase (beta-lactamase class C family)
MISLKSFTLGIVILPLLLAQPVLSKEASTEGTAGPNSTESARALASTTALKVSTYFLKPQLTQAQLEKAIAATEKLAQEQIEKGVVPGFAIGIVHNDKLVYAKGFGVRQAGKPEQIDANTVFQLASVSKSIASTVVASMIDKAGQGALSWNSKISDLDPAFSLYDPWVTNQITIADLFAHRSGLPDHCGDLLEDIGYDKSQILHRLRYQKPSSSFRSEYAYTNFGLTEAAIAAAKACHQTWEDASAENLYKPLHMDSTSSRYDDFVTRPNHAPGHVLVDGKWVAKYRRNPDAQSPAGGVSASVNDFANWMRLQLNDGKFEGKQLITREALAETHHPHILNKFSPINGLPEFYGLGFNVSYDQSGRLRLSHSGAFSRGVATNFSLIPAENLGICIFTNAYPIGVAEGISNTFMDTALYGKETQNWLPLFKKLFSDPATLGVNENSRYAHAPEVVAPALANASYLGKYTNDFFGAIDIIEKDGALALLIGPEKLLVPLKHFDRDTFTWEADTENLSGASGVTFAIAADGHAMTVIIDNLNIDGQGLFNRVSDKSASH